MKRFALVASCLALLVGLSARSFAQAVPKDIQDFYARAKAAEEKKDLDGLIKMSTPNFVLVDAQGQSHALAEIRQMWQAEMAVMSNLHIGYKIDKATVKAKSAVVVSAVTLTADLKNAKTGKVQKLKTTGKGSDILVKTAAGWKYQKTTVLSQTTTLDGKPAPGM